MNTLGRAMVVMALALAPVAAAAQGQNRPGQGPPARDNRRNELAQEIHRRFMTQVAERLGLDETQRTKLDQVLVQGMEARRDLARESRSLRMELMRAVHSDTAGEATYRGLLDGLQALQAKERTIEDHEAQELATFLDPRQQAMFLVMRMQFNDNVRRMQRPHSGRSGGGPGFQSS